MFDHIVLNRSIDGPALSIGEIAEALLFYQSVHIILDHSTLINLISQIGHHNIIKLLSLPYVKATYIEEFIGVHTEQTTFGPLHTLIGAYLSGGEEVGELKNSKRRLEYILLRAKLTQTEAINFTSAFRKLVSFRKISDDHFISGGIVSAAMDDLLDADYISAASQIVAKNLLKTEVLPSDYHFKINANGGRFKIITNINFDEINRIQKGKSSVTEDYSPAHVASELFNASYGLILAAHYGGDFYTSEINSNIIKIKNKHILSRTSCNKSVQNNFYTILLNGSPDVATTLNSGNRSFEEFLELLVKANRFKKWLKSKSPDENLISNYMQDITSSGWLNQSKGKFFRYIISNGAGFISPIGGLIFSAIDSFAIDKINFGWKPNQFINGNLKKFIDNK